MVRSERDCRSTGLSIASLGLGRTKAVQHLGLAVIQIKQDRALFSAVLFRRHCFREFPLACVLIPSRLHQRSPACVLTPAVRRYAAT